MEGDRRRKGVSEGINRQHRVGWREEGWKEEDWKEEKEEVWEGSRERRT